MKKTLSLTVYLLIFCFAQKAFAQENNFTLTGTTKGLNDRVIYFSWRGYGNERIWDSTTVKDEQFTFKGHLDGPWRGYMNVSAAGRPGRDNSLSLPPYLEPGNMRISITKDKFSEAILTGSKINDEYIAHERKKMPLYLKMRVQDNILDSLNESYDRLAEKDSLQRKKLERQQQQSTEKTSVLNDAITDMDIQFIKTHPASLISVNLLFTINLPDNEKRRLFAGLSDDMKKSQWGKALEEKIAIGQ